LSIQSPVLVSLIGCGAISELYYAPALQALERTGSVQVHSLFDPADARIAKLQQLFPAAARIQSLKDLRTDLAIVASPVRFHCEQTIAAFEAGAAVLCEKPMAATHQECQQMNAAAAKARKPLAVGLFRRFFPAVQTIQSVLASGVLGPVQTFCFTEGGSFNWPAQSASFFQKSSAQGGVLIDLGVHLLDLLIYWLGEPTTVHYEDDAMGGIESNCIVKLGYEGFSGSVRLSRDWSVTNRYLMQCEKGWLSWNVGQAEQVQMGLNGGTFALDARVYRQTRQRGLPALGDVGSSYPESFIDQLLNLVEALAGKAKVVVTGEEGMRSVALIERCYQSRQWMTMPWLSPTETSSAYALNAKS
jgi:predicted dehydrogenase